MNSLIRNLTNDVYCRIGVSTIVPGQVGVIAIKDIPSGTNPFQPAEKVKLRNIWIHPDELGAVPESVKKFISDFYSRDEYSGAYAMDSKGPNNLTIADYMNTSDSPNMQCDKNGTGVYECFVSTRLIHTGEELTYDYAV